MGLQLARSAFFHAARTGLDHAATRLLVHMALEAYDEDNAAGIAPRRYFHPRSTMARALGFDGMPERKPDSSAAPSEHLAWDAGNQRVKRALSALIRAGAIRPVSAGRPGFHAEFEVTVSAVDPAALGTLTVPHGGTVTVPHRSTLSVPPPVRSPSPLTEAPELQQITAAEHHHPARAHEGDRGDVDKSMAVRRAS